MKEKRARCKAKPIDNKRHDITAEPVLLSNTVECSDDIPNDGLCNDVTEQEVASGSVCDHNPELCDVTEYVVSSAADGADPFVLSDPPECNDWSVWEHNPPELCDVTQFEVATTPEDDTTVRERQLKEKRDRSKLDYYDNHKKNLAKSRKYRATNKQKISDYAKEYSKQYRATNKQKVSHYSKEYRGSNKHKVSVYSKEYHASHHKERLHSFKDYHIANREERLDSFKDYHIGNREERLDSFTDYHIANREERLDSFKDYHIANREERLDSFKDYHIANWEERLDAFRDNYIANREERLDAFRDNYIANREERLDAFRDNYIANREDRLEKSKDCYASNFEERKKTMNEYYASHSQQVKDNAREHYAAVADTKNEKLRQKYRIKHNINPPTKSVSAKKRSKIIARILQKNKAYYVKNFQKLRRNRRARYNLAEPKIDMKNRYIAVIRQKLAKNKGVQKQLKVAFNIDKSLPIAVTQSGINLIAARKLVTVILNIRKNFAGMLLGVIKKVNNNTYIGNGEFGDSYHVASGEPQFYQACYKDAPSNFDTDSR